MFHPKEILKSNLKKNGLPDERYYLGRKIFDWLWDKVVVAVQVGALIGFCLGYLVAQFR